MTSRSSAEPAGVDLAALSRVLLFGRAVVTVLAAGVGLFVTDHPIRTGAVIGLVALSAAAEFGALVRRPSVLDRTAAVLVVDSALLVAVLILDAGGAAFAFYAAGAAALAGVLLGRRAWPLWVVHAALGFGSAARILHADRPAPSVAAFLVAFPLVTVVSGAVAAWLTMTLIRPVEPTSAEIREPVDGLSPEDPDESFEAGIERRCREWSRSSRTPVRVIADPVEPSPATRHELTRILDEALRNVDQHADARRVDIWIRRAGSGVRLVVRDDGNGFSVPPDLSVLRDGDHFGVLEMAERARMIGADFIVRSAPSEGTLIEVLAPLEA
jgi:hypothetical protein